MHFTEDERNVITTDKYQPSVSIVLPTFPGDMDYKLRQVERKVNKELSDAYPADKVATMQERLHETIAGIDTAHLKKTLAIYVSPVVSKVFHLEITADEKITIDESFEIRDLVYARQESAQFLVLLLTGRHARLLLADDGHLTRLPARIPEDIEAFENDVAAKVANFSDPNKRKEIVLDKFLHHVDEGLSAVLTTHPLPVFLLGAKRETGHFASLTHNGKKIAGTIHGSYDEASPGELMKVLAPPIADWKKTKEKALLQELQGAQNTSRADFGIHMVWKAALQKNVRLLIVEKNYKYPAEYITPTEIRLHEPTDGNTLFIKDAVDDVIEKVIAGGGDVQFVADGMLDEYLHIAAIRHF